MSKHEREMLALRVYINELGQIAIAQPTDYDEADVVSVHPAQVDLLCQWLQEVRRELEGRDSVGNGPDSEAEEED